MLQSVKTFTDIQLQWRGEQGENDKNSDGLCFFFFSFLTLYYLTITNYQFCMALQEDWMVALFDKSLNPDKIEISAGPIFFGIWGLPFFSKQLLSGVNVWKRI